jgi:isoleucyl-tRNA synthetase
MIPFMTEEIYRNLVCSIDEKAPASIHLCDFPVCDEAMIDETLEARMNEILDVVVLGRACRDSAKIKNRQPIAKIFVKVPVALSEEHTEIIEDELNVKEVVYTDDVSAFASYSFKPEKRALGKKYGKFLKKIGEMLQAIDGNAAMAELNETGMLKLDLGDIVAEIKKEELLISAAKMPGFEALSSENGATVVLDTNLTPELIEEGNAREIVSKIQNLRKDTGLKVLDQIKVYVVASDAIRSVITKNADDIMTKTLCTGFVDGTCATSQEYTIGKEKVTIGVEKV